MTRIRVQAAASHRLDEIYRYTADRWGDAQADTYMSGLFQRFEDIAARRFPWRSIPAECEVNGYVCRYRSHLVYWRELSDGAVGIVTVLHGRMHQIERFAEDFGE
jgi:toxin ParE1/3/4